MTCTSITDSYDCINICNILHRNILHMFVCLWHVAHPVVL